MSWIMNELSTSREILLLICQKDRQHLQSQRAAEIIIFFDSSFSYSFCSKAKQCVHMFEKRADIFLQLMEILSITKYKMQAQIEQSKVIHSVGLMDGGLKATFEWNNL